MVSAKFRLEAITDKIFHLNFKKQVTLTSTFLRFQEHYESPEFKGKVFTLKEFKHWYSGKGNNPFEYYWDWEGFNLPSPMLEPFFDGKFNPLTQNEKALLKTFEPHRGKRFCIVGTHGDNNDDVLMHEIAHGLWFTENKYRRRAQKALKALTKENDNKLTEMLESSGYHRDVFSDEKHAYIVANSYFLKMAYDIGGPDVDSVYRKLTFLYNLYMHLQERKSNNRELLAPSLLSA